MGITKECLHEQSNCLPAILSEWRILPKNLVTFNIFFALKSFGSLHPDPRQAWHSSGTESALFHGTLFEFLPGEHREMESLDETALKAWGRALGELHQAAEGFKAQGRPGWQSQIATIRERVPQSEKLVWQEAEAVEKNLRMLPITKTNYGLIHFDFEPDNIVWLDGEIGIFDLDDCACAWFAMDVSNALCSELFNDQVGLFDFADPRLAWFLEGHRAVRALTENEVAWMPLFLRLDNLVSFARKPFSLPCNQKDWAELR